MTTNALANAQRQKELSVFLRICRSFSLTRLLISTLQTGDELSGALVTRPVFFALVARFFDPSKETSHRRPLVVVRR